MLGRSTYTEQHPKSIINFVVCPSRLFAYLVVWSSIWHWTQGKLHVWVPHADPKSPCALWCRSLNTTGPALVVQLAARVHDGTRCKPGSLDMCIDGICQVGGPLVMDTSLLYNHMQNANTTAFSSLAEFHSLLGAINICHSSWGLGVNGKWQHIFVSKLTKRRVNETANIAIVLFR